MEGWKEGREKGRERLCAHVHTAESESRRCKKREKETAENESTHCRKRERDALQKARVRTAESDRKTETHVRTHTHTHARTHFRAYTSTHARTHRPAKTHTRTQTHDRQVLTNLARHNEEARNTIREAGGEALARAALKRHRTALQVEHYAQWCLGALLVHA